MLGPGKSVDTLIVGVWNKKTKCPPHTLGVLSVQVVLSQLKILSVQVVLSQLKMSNLESGGPGEFIGTHIAWFPRKFF